MKLTKKGITLLTKQYKSVLKKCFLINMGLFALGAVGAVNSGVANAATTLSPTLNDLQSKASTVMPTLKHYELTTTKGDHTHSIVINGTTYYYTPSETTPEKNAMLNYLAGSSTVAIKTGDSSNYVFNVGSTYYTFDTDKLPTSMYSLSAGISTDYDIKTTDGTTTSYYKFDLNNSKITKNGLASVSAGTSSNYDFQALKAINDGTIKDKYYNTTIDPSKASSVGSKLPNINWSTEAPSGYTWANDYVAGSKVTVSGGNITGAIRLKTPHNGTVGGANTWNKYFTYTYTKPTDYTITQERLDDNVTADAVKEKVFANIKNSQSSGIANGGAIYNTKDNSTVDIIADFVGNSSTTTSYSYSYGGAISNYAYYSGTASIGSIVGDFVGNSSSSDNYSYGGAISNYAKGGTASATIGSIVGDFVGNSSSSPSDSHGGAISNYAYNSTASATIGSIVGDFVGNSSSSDYSSYGGAISNYAYNSTAGATIGSIVGDFVGNSSFGSSHSYGGAISNYADYDTASATIGSIVGDFVGNSSSSDNYSYGGAISNYADYDTASATIGSIVGNFVGNSSFGSYDSSYGGAISNFAGSGTASIGSITGDFVGNSSSTSSSYCSSYGGAISNFAGSGTASIGSITGDFTGNYAKTTSTSYKAYGGAIFNGYAESGIPQYREKAQITLAGNTFTGNYVQVGSTQTPNSIYNAGVINIADGATVTINDGYDGMSQAQLKIGTGSNFNLSVDNGEPQTDNLGTVTNNGTINWDLDVDLTGGTSDNITVTGGSISGTNSIIIHAINLMTDKEGETNITFASGSPIGAYILSATINDNIYSPGGFEYTVTYNNSTGILTFNGAVMDTLVSWIAKTEPTNKEYTIASGGEIVAEDLGTLVNNLKVTGNGETTTNKVIGGNFAGVSLGATTQTLELKDIAQWSGFTGNAVNNDAKGTVKVENVTFKDNTTADIANAGKLEFKGTNSLEKITGNGNMEVKSGTTTVTTSLAQGTLTVTSGELKNNGTATIGGGSNAGTIDGTGSLTNNGEFENKSGATISQDVTHNGIGTNVFTNNGTISGAVTNTGVFDNNSSITGAVTNSGTFTNNSTISSTLTNSGTFTNGNNGTISGAVTNTGTITTAAEKMTGSVANNEGGTLNLSGTLAKEITGTGTTNVNSTLAMNNGANIEGTLNMNGGTVTISNNAITSHNVGELKGNGNIAIDINYGETDITSDEIHVTSDVQDSTIKITSINEIGTRAANFEKQILFGTDGSTKLDITGLSGWNGSTEKQEEVALKSNTLAYNADLGTRKWTEKTELSVIGSAEGLKDTLKYTTTTSNVHFDPKAENLTAINNYSGTGSNDRKMDFTGIQTSALAGTYTMQANTSLGTTAAGKLTLDGEENTTTRALTVVDLNGNAGFNLTNATELVLDEVKLTGASGNVITASNDGASVSLNNAYVDGNIVKNGGEKMTVTTTGTTTLAGNTTNVSLTNSGTLTNNGTITGDVVNSGTLASSADKISGTITNNATFNMSGDLTKNIAGSGTTVLQSDTSAVAANRTVSGTLNANGKTIGMKDDAFETLTVGNLSGNGNITINAKAATQESDKIDITGDTDNSSALKISALSLDTTGLDEGVDYTKTMSVVSGNTSGVSVAFANEDVAKDYNKTGVDISKLLGTDSVDDKDVGWNETFGNWEQARKKNTSLTISGTDMVYTVTNYTVGDKVYTSNSEGLKELNAFDAGTETKTFNAASTGTTHTVIEDLGNTVGKLSIDGKGGTLDFGGTHKAFEKIDTGAEVNLNNVKLTNANGDIANVVGGKLTATNSEIDGTLTSAGTVSLTNSSVSGDVTNSGTLNLSNSTIDGIIVGSGDAQLNVNSDWEMDTTVTGHTVNVSNAKLTVGAGNLVGSDSLTAKDGSEIDIAANKVSLDKAEFKSGSKLSLKVDSLNNFGAINANNITVENGANLSATLAQGIVKIGQKETLQLLKADNTDFNNFADSFDNEMYHFEKADNNGLYNISQVKTAKEVVEESGGTTTEVRAAAAWVDGDEFAEGSTAKKVADTLADFAQNDPQEFNNTLSVVAPQDAPVVETGVTDASDKLLLTVEDHLTGNDIGGLSSGDALQDVSIWAKGYYGKSKLSDSGNIKGFDSKNRGVIAGVDKKLNNAVKLGFGFQYNDSDIDAFRRDVEVDTVTGFIYGEYRPSNWYVNGIASYGRSDYKEKKYALGFKIDDKYNADTYSLQAITGYDFKYVSPEIGARYYHIKRYGYDDSIGQKVSGSNMDLLRGVLGLRASHEFGMFKPEVYVGMTYDFVNDKDNAIVSLPNGSSYAVDSKRLKRFGTEVNANLTANLTDHASVTLGYEGKFRKDYKDNTGLIIAKYAF